MKLSIRRAIDQGPSHAYVFSGPPASGKYEAAIEFAAGVLCESSGAPCRDCEICRRIWSGVHPDVLIFEPEGTSYLVEQVRSEIVPEASLAPVEAAHRFLIIREAERLNPASSNALLKTLEEPLGNVTFVLLAPGALLETISSRCQVVAFEHMSPDEIIAALEAQGIDSDAARRAARISGGRIDRAQRLDDEALAARDRILGIPSRLRAGPLAAAIDSAAELKAAVEEQVATESDTDRHKREIRRARGELFAEYLDALASWYRDVAVIQSGADDALLINPEWKDQLAAEARALPHSAPLAAQDFIAQTRRDWARNPREEIWLERLMVALHALEH
ncbi:MAG: hypothetical protein DCC49_05315 [Acidobacteria bacterium]|nr:MAG: hypothetical protein DCC49_05315 [Acidobacteriota bacterium]